MSFFLYGILVQTQMIPLVLWSLATSMLSSSELWILNVKALNTFFLTKWIFRFLNDMMAYRALSQVLLTGFPLLLLINIYLIMHLVPSTNVRALKWCPHVPSIVFVGLCGVILIRGLSELLVKPMEWWFLSTLCFFLYFWPLQPPCWIDHLFVCFDLQFLGMVYHPKAWSFWLGIRVSCILSLPSLTSLFVTPFSGSLFLGSLTR